MSKNPRGAPDTPLFLPMNMINSDIFCMTYGSFVMQLLRDYKSASVVNTELYKLGYNMGLRLVEEFFAKSYISQCVDFAQTVQVIAKVAFDMFLGVEATCSSSHYDDKTFFIVFRQNPLLEYVAIPPGYDDLIYCNVICGVIAGALRTLQLVVECKFIEQRSLGSPVDRISLRLLNILHEGYIEEEQ